MPVSVDTLLVHPMLARRTTRGWRCNAPLPRGTGPVREYTLEQRPLFQLYQVVCWLDRHRARLVTGERGLLDLRRQRLCRVDMVCEMDGRPAVLCLLPGRRRGLSAVEQGYLRTLRRVGAETYGADLRALALRVMPSGRVFAHEAPPPAAQ
jgi:hypothetical protein